MATEASLMLSSADALAWLSLLSASDDGGGIGADFLAVFVAGGAVSASCKCQKSEQLLSVSVSERDQKAGSVEKIR